jgi:hypothetical protein
VYLQWFHRRKIFFRFWPDGLPDVFCSRAKNIASAFAGRKPHENTGEFCAAQSGSWAGLQLERFEVE